MMETVMNETQIFASRKAWENRADEFVNGVSAQFAKEHANWQEMNSNNEGCWNCIDCFECFGCTSCVCCVSCGNLHKMEHKYDLVYDVINN